MRQISFTIVNEKYFIELTEHDSFDNNVYYKVTWYDYDKRLKKKLEEISSKQCSLFSESVKLYINCINIDLLLISKE